MTAVKQFVHAGIPQCQRADRRNAGVRRGEQGGGFVDHAGQQRHRSSFSSIMRSAVS
ncbi:hypothetical protein [Mycobacterium persicum]|uniref:hypothetical protein n=1 Tax=Mycobacterium persicum TaxID=1487726 RepID=UPI001301FF9C|nr:hypothetical protein [Mycobacterium persicum]